jgi:hypothetical protein
MKNSNDTIGNRTCDLPACSVVPQPTVPPPIPDLLSKILLLFTVPLDSFFPTSIPIPYSHSTKFRNNSVTEDPAHIGIEYTYDQTHT